MNKLACKVFALSFFFALIINDQTFAQGKGTSDYPEGAVPSSVIPPSPEGASLGKYGDIPVSMFHGSPAIDIPVHTLKKGGIVLPVSFNYTTSGIKLKELATNVGLGWTLMAGGALTIVVHDKSDLNHNRNIPFDPKTFNPNSGTADAAYNFAKTYINGTTNTYDLEPDEYFYNFCGKSGKFFFDVNNQVGYSVPKNDLKISRSSGTFTITDAQGIVYQFGLGELSSIRDSVITGSPGSPIEAPFQQTIYLTHITDPKGGSVTLEYENTNYKYTSGIEEKKYLLVPQGSCSLLNDIVTYKNQSIFGKRIKRIYSHDFNTEIVFNYSSTNREDLLPVAATDIVSALDNVVVKSVGKVLKTFTLSHGYFRSSDYSAGDPGTAKVLKSRLKLTGITESGKPPYLFQYNESVNLPSRLNFSSDYWGYYTGRNAATGIPSNGTYNFNGADLSVNPATTQANILQTITYPTGGSTTITYEQNQIAYHDAGGNLIPYSAEYDCTARHLSTQTFTLSALPADGVTINYFLDGGSHSPSKATIDGPNSFHQVLTGTGSLHLVLPLGTYTIAFDNLAGVNDIGLNFAWNIYQSYDNGDVNRDFGGVRVKQTTDQPVSGVPVNKYYQYTSATGSGLSSLSGEYNPGQFNANYTKVSYPDNVEHDCVYHVLYSNPLPLLGKAAETDFGYRTVTELTDAAGIQGKTVNSFTLGLTDFINPYTNSDGIEDDWASGLPLQQDQYAFNASTSQFVLRNHVKTQYTVNLDTHLLGDNTNAALPPNQYSLYGMKITQTRPENMFQLLVQLAGFEVEVYPVVSAWYYSSQKEETQYKTNDQTNPLTTITNYYYDNPAHLQLTRSSASTSDGKVKTNIITYAQDYTAGTGFLDDMNANHLSGVPVEQVEYIADGTKTTVLSGRGIEYKAGGNGEADRVLNLESDAPILLSAFKFSDRTTGVLPYGTASSGYSPDSHYKEKFKYNFYDRIGNPLMVTQTDGSQLSYIWDYRSNYPIAVIRNSDTLSTAYTSFEAGGTGHWAVNSTQRDSLTAAFSGYKSYNLSGGNITKSGLTATATYVVSYWTRNASPLTITGTITGYPLKGATINGWTYYEHQVTGQTTVTVSGIGNIDELRLYPKGAQMTTYSYTPLVGTTTVVDAKNTPVYYEYDNFQRLINIKDKDGNIIKHTDYHYSGQ